MSRKIFAAFVINLSSTFELFARRGRRSGGDHYDGPLPDGDEVGQFVLYAVGFAVVGFIILKVSDVFKDQKDSNASTAIGCLGILCFLGTITCLLPLLLWVELVVNSILGIGIIIIISVVVLFGGYSILKKIFS